MTCYTDQELQELWWFIVGLNLPIVAPFVCFVLVYLITRHYEHKICLDEYTRELLLEIDSLVDGKVEPLSDGVEILRPFRPYGIDEYNFEKLIKK